MLSDEPSPDTPSPEPGWFATTHWSVVLAAGETTSSQAEVALEKLCRAYWYPLYAHVRRRGYSPHDAQDLTQGFFARLLEKNWVGAADREKGKFRSFLLSVLDHYLGDERDRANAAKRGGGQALISLDEQTAEKLLSQEPASYLSPEKEFDKSWAAALLQQGMTRLRGEFEASGKGQTFDQLKLFLEGEANSGDYAAMAVGLGMSANAIAVSVHRLRQRYRELVRVEVANTVASPNEVEDEMRYLFSVLAQSA